ncbi:unnamed protein product [Cuscuta europaea]|uniref:Retrovirus-related Pol polyprotein from transposon RE1 n=1 Tax=Cuscuta europaea TaxID=41803 RepID=A0A9P1EGM3_CUSEU|nr:unnamed protein product [Cuscuta europaea]
MSSATALTFPISVDTTGTSLTIINLTNVVKLTSTTYLSWKIQVEALLVGYGLSTYIDGTQVSPPATITDNNVPSPNPAYERWKRKDKLMFGAIAGTLDPTIIPLISQAATSKEAWDILAHTFARPTRGQIKQTKSHLKNTKKGSHSITHYLHTMKTCADQLTLLGKPMDIEDLVEHILDGLDSNYQCVIDAVNGRDVPITFDELHEKLLNKELELQAKQVSSVDLMFPATAHATNFKPKKFPSTSRSLWNSAPSKQSITGLPNKRPAKPYLGRCQWCHVQGHNISYCPVFQQQHPSIKPPPPPRTNSSLPQAHVAMISSPSESSWLLDNGACHHVTSDLGNLSLHKPYDGTEEIVIGDGSGLPISYTGPDHGSTSSQRTN